MTAFQLSSTEWIAVNVFAVYRLTILVTRDVITEPIRHRIKNHLGLKAFDFITCPWCTSIWLAAIVVLLTATVPNQWRFVAYVLMCSAVASFLAEHS